MRNIMLVKMHVRTVSKEIRYWAWDMGVSKAAKKAKVSRSLLDKVINHRYKIDSLEPETMGKIAKAAGITVNEAFPLLADSEAS